MSGEHARGDDTVDGTLDDSGDSRRRVAARPGLVVVFSNGSIMHHPIALERGAITLGREGKHGASLPDDRLSREHTEVRFAPDVGWTIRDLDSRNGTFVDGERVRGRVRVPSFRALRAASTILVPCADVTEARAAADERGGMVVGSALRRALAAVEHAAATSRTLLLRGETGTGKELAARAFHERGPCADGPFVAINCATIPEGLAERILFGAKRGAYSGAESDTTGLVQAAHRGVLFLDEAGELDLGVQAKLLRVLETGEVTQLGASQSRTVDLRVCAATHRDLRAAVAAGRFRSDLYHRLAPPEVVLPRLHAREDEIAHHVWAAILAVSKHLTAHARLVEECLLRAWPGNVRELRKELHHAATRALAEGSERVRVLHLSAEAGRPFEPAAPDEAARDEGARDAKTKTPSEGKGDADAADARSYVRWSRSITRERLEQVLEEQGGNVAFAARALGMQRTQIYREMERHAVKRQAREA